MAGGGGGEMYDKLRNKKDGLKWVSTYRSGRPDFRNSNTQRNGNETKAPRSSYGPQSAIISYTWTMLTHTF